MGFLSQQQMEDIGFLELGTNIRISDKASFYNPSKISIGSHCRIDDFCILSAGEGKIIIGRHVHIGCYVSLLGRGKIVVEDFAGISARVSVYSSNDDYSGNVLTGPTVPTNYTNVRHADVIIKRHAIIGAGSVVLPGVTIHEGGAVGALSLLTKDVQAFCLVAGIPAKYIKDRSRNLLAVEQRFLNEG